MPQANSPTNSIKNTPLTVDSAKADDFDERAAEIEEIHGNGALDKFSNDRPDRSKAQDRDSGGVKSRKVDEANG